MARRRSRAERKPPRHVSVVVIVLAALILAAMAWRLIGLRTQLETARFERDRYQEQVDELAQENKSLSDDLEEGVTDEKVQEIARDDLGLALPGEYIFYNTGSTGG